MRKQYFWWTFLVGGLVCTIYGAYTLIYHLNHGNGLKPFSLLLLILGSIALIIFFILFLLSKKKSHEEKPAEKVIEEKIELVKEEEKPKPAVQDIKPQETIKQEYKYERNISSHRDVEYEDAYIKKVGFGPVLRVNGKRILDMRNNTYYRIEGNFVHQEGYGPVFEISGNKIRSSFGGYLYEISGDSVNKTYGGYFASFSSGYIKIHDLSEIYEVSNSLTLYQKLIVVALLFGAY